MDKKVFLAMAICAGIFLMWQNLYLKPLTEKQQVEQRQTQFAQVQEQSRAEATTATLTTTTSGKGGGKASNAPAEVTLGSSQYAMVVSAAGGTIQSVQFPEYKGQRTGNLDLLVGGQGQLRIETPAPEWQYLSNVRYTIEPKGTDSATLTYDDANVTIVRNYTLKPAMFALDHTIDFRFKKAAPNYVFLGLRAPREIPKNQSENEKRMVMFNKSGGQKTWTVTDIDAVKEDLGEGNWFGFSSRYFLNAVVDQGFAVHPQFQARPIEGGDATASFIYKTPGSAFKIPVRMYYGPKEIDMLKSAAERLGAAVDFGWFTIFAYPLLKALKWFYKYVHNFGIAIILLTVFVKLLTYPLTLKSMKSMKQMQRIQPQLNRLREKYKDDKEKLNKEMLQLMKANGYNPASGCLPMFIQMPIFIALYNVLYGAIDLYGQPFFGWIHDLSAKDPLYVTPALMAIMMFLQQKLTPSTAADPAQQRMMMMMPVVFGFMMLWLPSGLTLYMLVNSVVSILQQVWINRRVGLGGPAQAAA